jgi:hypothetical protein
VHGAAAGPVGELTRRGARLPVPGAALSQPQQLAGAPKRPAAGGHRVQQTEQRPLDPRVDARRDRTYQPERVFPRNATNSMACSLTVSSSRAISARAA